MGLDGSQVHVGMEVLAADAQRVGQVKAVEPFAVLVDRPLQRDLYVPLYAIESVTDTQLVLPIPEHQVDRMGWPHPPLWGEPEAGVGDRGVP